MKRRAFLFLAVAVALLAGGCETLDLEWTALTAEDYQARGFKYFDRNDYDSAIAEFTKAINLDPDFALAYIDRGHAYYGRSLVYAGKGDWEMYLADKERAVVDWADGGILLANQRIQLNPNNAYAYSWRGLAYSDKKEYDRAFADFEHAIQLDPNNSNTYYFRGVANYNKKDYDSAIADFSKAIRIDPNNFYCYSRQADVYYKQGDYDNAIANFEAMLLIKPNDILTKHWLENARQMKER
ncbi:MAG: tetratricopeptide repeat protein [Treponema sp.]|nr:tetratricopeptide repeat protein [Treponema sp.]